MAARLDALTYIAEFWEQNPRIWFSATPDDDQTITNKLEPFIDEFAEFSLATLPTTDLKQKVGWVILYDQVLKHVNRHQTLMEPKFTPYQAPANLAVQCWEEFQKYSHPDSALIDFQSVELTDFQAGFLLMPIRHTHELSQVKSVLSAAWSRLAKKPANTDTTFMRNYIKATYTRLAKFMDADDPESYQDYMSVPPEHLHKFITINLNLLIDLFDVDKGYLDAQCYGDGITNPQCYGDETGEINVVTRLIPPTNETISSDKLLTRASGASPLSTRASGASPLLTCMSSFMAANGIPANTPIGANPVEPPLVVSLSGGVDSMVCAYLLWALGIPFKALHVNYSNRASEICAKEEFLVQYYCALLGIPLRVIRTDEINRPKCMEHGLREVYEEYTRVRRFNGYLSFADLLDGKDDRPCVRVILGHNQDDTIENILTNLAGQSHYENLRGMQPVSTQTHRGKNIQFLRPLLGISKREIYSFANEHRIPYLVDSTPKWSQRGKIRDIVRPALDAWNPEMLGALQTLSDRMTDMQATLDSLIKPQLTNEFADINQVPKTQSYWSRVFAGIPVSQKTLREWIAKLEFLAQHPTKLIANQQIKFRLAKTTELEIIRVVDKSGFSRIRISII